MPAQSHTSSARILGRRTIERDHRCLARVLQPGMSVLDIGCGTGAITAGAARAVGPHGSVLGIDRDEALLEVARSEHAALTNLRFELGDATALPFRAEFDVVTAARTLQWIADPERAVSNIKQAAKPSGTLVVLDYNHASNTWEPDPPPGFRLFYDAFLAWRHANRWDNELADHLPDLFRSAGLIHIECTVEDEIARRGEPDFSERSDLWCEVIDKVGATIVAGGYCTEYELTHARDTYAAWVQSDLLTQTLKMRAITGIVP